VNAFTAHAAFIYFTLFICSEYMTYVMEALELEDTVKNYERSSSTGWFVLIMFLLSFSRLFLFVFQAGLSGLEIFVCCHVRKYISSFRPARTGKLGASFDRMGNFQIHYPFSFL
jgi:hypothetical protein